MVPRIVFQPVELEQYFWLKAYVQIRTVEIPCPLRKQHSKGQPSTDRGSAGSSISSRMGSFRKSAASSFKKGTASF